MTQHDKLMFIRPSGARCGKRVAANCPLTHAERREYVTRGLLYCVKLVKEGRKISLRDATNLVYAARGYGYDPR